MMQVKKGVRAVVRHKGQLYLISANENDKETITPLPPAIPFEVLAKDTSKELHDLFSARYRNFYAKKKESSSSEKGSSSIKKGSSSSEKVVSSIKKGSSSSEKVVISPDPIDSGEGQE